MRGRELVADRTQPGPTWGLAAWWWGTNRAGGTYYAGRVHVVHPDHRSHGLCGLP
jgi:hypothetical protein